MEKIKVIGSRGKHCIALEGGEWLYYNEVTGTSIEGLSEKQIDGIIKDYKVVDKNAVVRKLTGTKVLYINL